VRVRTGDHWLMSKLFLSAIWNFRNKLAFVTGNPFHLSLMFVGTAGTYPSGTPKKNLLLPANVRLGWKSLPGSNILAFYKISEEKRFLTLGPGCTFHGVHLLSVFLSRAKLLPRSICDVFAHFKNRNY
jgi:hypothetical protein